MPCRGLLSHPVASGVFFACRDMAIRIVIWWPARQLSRDGPAITTHTVMIPFKLLRFLRATGALLLALGCAALAGAAPLLPVRLTDQGIVPAGAGSQLAVVNGIPLVLEG